MSSRVIIDITELASWQGKLTGVPRVMDEISRRLSYDPTTIFVVWDGVIKTYCIVDYSMLSQARTEETGVVEALPIITTAGIHTFVKRMAVKNKLTRTMALKARDRVRSFQDSKAVVVPLPDAIRFTKTDKLLVLADWHGNDESFVDKLVTLKKQGITLIQMSYDMLPIVTPQYSGHSTATFMHYVQRVYPICDHIVTISDHTKKDIVSWFTTNSITAVPITVVRLGDDFHKSSATKPMDQEFLSAYKKDKKFVLCVGTIEARKNHTLLYYTYKRAVALGISLPTLVIVGRLGWLADNIHEIMIKDPQVNSKFIFLTNTSDEELSWLYEHCMYTVYPSFYEGWGLPVAESVMRQTPCLTSRTSSIPEVAGDLVDYFDPSSPDECLERMQSLLDLERLAIVKARLKSYKPTKWDDTFVKIKQVVEAQK
jgi:glycosyltransferase involved in cell wall biosynthesis